GTKEYLFVESLLAQVHPDGTIVLTKKDSLFKAFEHDFPTEEIRLRFVVEFVEGDTHSTVGDIETIVHPTVHFLPQGNGFRIFIFPFTEHLGSQLHYRILLPRLPLLYSIFTLLCATS